MFITLRAHCVPAARHYTDILINICQCINQDSPTTNPEINLIMDHKLLLMQAQSSAKGNYLNDANGPNFLKCIASSTIPFELAVIALFGFPSTSYRPEYHPDLGS